jgi:hypothetical protein
MMPVVVALLAKMHLEPTAVPHFGTQVPAPSQVLMVPQLVPAAG